ncbi:uncharacterized protein [Solanum lycopersicum]|uniref:uncharacterized protein n=1 Tax=Solanum lycopersicum TaxID=4081 RepID=UPI0002BCB52A
MPPQRGFRGSTSRRNVEPQEQGVAKAPNVQPQREFINVEFRESIQMELKEARVREFLTLKQDSLSVHEYELKFTKITRYALEMVKDMRSMIILFVVVFGRSCSKVGRVTMLIGRLIIYVHQVEEKKLRDTEEFKNKRAKKGNEPG